MKIDFVTACNGGLEFYAKRNFVGFSLSASQAAYMMMRFGVSERLMASSSMDFAEDAGFFDADGATRMLKNAFEFMDKVKSEAPNKKDFA